MRMGGRRYSQRFTPGKYARFPLYRSLGGIQLRSLQVRIIFPAPGFDQRADQPVENGYTVGAIPAHLYKMKSI
jgi:hypothetical protein